MPKPTVEQIRGLMRAQKYEDYIVSDTQSFPHCLPLNPDAVQPQQERGEKPNAFFERYKTWAKNNLTAEGQRLYDRANQSVPAGLSARPGTNTARTFVNSRSETTKAKSSECSNFARHAIGTLIQHKDITDHYNIVYAGIMGGAHNIAILVPKDQKLPLVQGLGAAPTLRGDQLPKGSLFIDPWSLGMGNDFNSSFGCTKAPRC